MCAEQGPASLADVRQRWHRAADNLQSVDSKVRRLEQELRNATAQRDALRAEESSALQQLEMMLAEEDVEDDSRQIKTFQPGKVGVKLAWPFVVEVLPESQAWKEGVCPGWRIHKVDDEEGTEELFQKCVSGEEPYTLIFQCKAPVRDSKRPAALATTPPRLVPMPERTWSIATPRELLSPAGSKAEKRTCVEEDYEDWERGLESLSLAFSSRDRAANLKACLMKATVPRMLSLPM
mmetsp:Transcript_73852/g.175806  ORF Transcript_73852/g.175806 Transcript_73852/m.175806 type:complete len:236 (-) Transcript_73852:216-923(-)|eukprot:CAMPEP_0178410388 /NCGR_PEP_ID=MMETSP0689_2-20121128/20953_1 /TAXON_ID=160604 /ORGANISM="Amphidinium massartii, Strain CS-259" /LENGTH=235 /DNA_ID=CAMNT_0020031561 /DNA_START=79 /DNA_END=786 /DNA_ORIENTATION=+